MVLRSCILKIMFKEAIERMVLRQYNFRIFSGLFTISRQFRAQAGF